MRRVHGNRVKPTRDQKLSFRRALWSRKGPVWITLRTPSSSERTAIAYGAIRILQLHTREWCNLSRGSMSFVDEGNGFRLMFRSSKGPFRLVSALVLLHAPGSPEEWQALRSTCVARSRHSLGSARHRYVFVPSNSMSTARRTFDGTAVKVLPNNRSPLPKRRAPLEWAAR
jgi:hypothetical protein